VLAVDRMCGLLVCLFACIGKFAELILAGSLSSIYSIPFRDSLNLSTTDGSSDPSRMTSKV